MKIKLLEAYTRDVGRGVCRIDYNTMDKLGCATGDSIEIQGDRKTVAKCLPLYPSDEGKGMIRCDGLIRENLKCQIGCEVEIIKIKVTPAVRVYVKFLEAVPPIDMRYLADALESVSVVKGDNSAIPYFGGRIRIKVMRTIPKGYVVINQHTQFFNIEEIPAKPKPICPTCGQEVS